MADNTEREFCRLCNCQPYDLLLYPFMTDLYGKYKAVTDNGGKFHLMECGKIHFRLNGKICDSVPPNLGFIETINTAYKLISAK